MVWPAGIVALGVTPHMHLIVKDMTVTGPRAGEETSAFDLSVEEWDFNWQESYRYNEPQTPAKRGGTSLDLSANLITQRAIL